VASPADDIPDLERLMRNVIRMAMEAEKGDGWMGTLSISQQEGIRRAGERATKKRPDEWLRDDDRLNRRRFLPLDDCEFGRRRFRLYRCEVQRHGECPVTFGGGSLVDHHRRDA
jgi:hypothetical protein